MFAAYVMCGAQDKDAVRLTLEQIDVVRRMCTEYKEFELATSAQGTVHLKCTNKYEMFVLIPFCM